MQKPLPSLWSQNIPAVNASPKLVSEAKALWNDSPWAAVPLLFHFTDGFTEIKEKSLTHGNSPGKTGAGTGVP